MTMTATEMVDAAARSGAVVTARQLERWRGFGLIEKGSPVSLGRGRGVRWSYPPCTVQRIVAITAMRQQRLPLAEIGIRLWLQGETFGESDVRRWLDNGLESFRRFVAAASPIDEAETFIERLAVGPASERTRYGVKGNPRAYDTLRDGAEDVMRALKGSTDPLTPEANAFMMSTMGISSSAEADLKRAQIDFPREMALAMRTAAGFANLVSNASYAELLAAKKLAGMMSALILALRSQPREALHAIASFMIEVDDRMPYSASTGFLMALAAVSQAVREIGVEKTLEKLEQAGITSEPRHSRPPLSMQRRDRTDGSHE